MSAGLARRSPCGWKNSGRAAFQSATVVPSGSCFPEGHPWPRAGSARNSRQVRIAATRATGTIPLALMPPRSSGRSEGDAEAQSDRASLLEHARVVQRHPVRDVVAVDVLEIRAAGAAGLGVVDQVVVARDVDVGVRERVEAQVRDVL